MLLETRAPYHATMVSALVRPSHVGVWEMESLAWAHGTRRRTVATNDEVAILQLEASVWTCSFSACSPFPKVRSFRFPPVLLLIPFQVHCGGLGGNSLGASRLGLRLVSLTVFHLSRLVSRFLRSLWLYSFRLLENVPLRLVSAVGLGRCGLCFVAPSFCFRPVRLCALCTFHRGPIEPKPVART